MKNQIQNGETWFELRVLFVFVFTSSTSSFVLFSPFLRDSHSIAS